MIRVRFLLKPCAPGTPFAIVPVLADCTAGGRQHPTATSRVRIPREVARLGSVTTLQTNPGPQRRSSLARGSGAAIVALGGLLGVCGCGATAEPTSTENSAGTVSVAGTDGAAAGAAGTATAGPAPLGDA